MNNGLSERENALLQGFKTRHKKMGFIGKIFKFALIGACLYGVYQCNRSMIEARERRQSSQLELKVENEEITAVRDLGNQAVYGHGLQEGYS